MTVRPANDRQDTQPGAGQLLHLAAGVAAALGDGWEAVPGYHVGAASVRHRDGRGLFFVALTYPWSARGRAEVRGEYPAGWSWRERAITVTVSVGRDPAAVARDLERRLLPRYLPELELARERVASEAAEEAGRERVAAELLAAVPGAVRSPVQGRSDGVELRLPGHGYRHDVRVRSSDGTVVDVDLRGVPAEDAVRMLAALGTGAGAVPGAAGREGGRRRVLRFPVLLRREREAA
jgi:hypothetical protein